MTSSLTATLALTFTLIFIQSSTCMVVPPTSATSLESHGLNYARGLHVLLIFTDTIVNVPVSSREGVDTELLNETCQLLSYYYFAQQMSADNLTILLRATLHHGCLHLREVYGEIASNSSSSNNNNSNTESGSRNSTLAEEDSCYELNYLHRSCAPHLKQVVKQQVETLFTSLNYTEGFYWCRWINANIETQFIIKLFGC